MKLGIDAGGASLEYAAEHGAAGVTVSSKEIFNKGLDAVIDPILAAGCEICQINAMGYNPLYPDKEQLKEQRDVVLKVIELTESLECPYISINAGNYHSSGFLHGDKKNRTAAALADIAEEIKPVLNHAGKRGKKICLEPYVKGAVYSAESYLTLRDLLGSDSKALRINLDVASLYDLDALMNPEFFCVSLCRKLQGHAGLVHLKDIKLEEKFHIHADLTPLGKGVTNWKQVIENVVPWLDEESWLVIEHVQSSEEAGSSIKLIRDLCAEAGFRL